MTILIKSDTTVVSSDREFAYYTSYGITDKHTAAFIKGMSESGYTLSNTEFAAIKTFRDNLIAKRLWDEVYEVYPMMGGSAATAAIKLKSLTGKSKMLPQYGLDDNYFELSGGKVLGKKVTTPAINSQPSYNTQLKVSELPTKYVGYHFYMGEAVPHSGSLRQPVIGTRSKSGASNADYSVASVNVNESQISLVHLSATTALTGSANDMAVYSFVSKPNVYNVSAVASYYKNGVLLGSGQAAALITPNLDGEVALGFLGSSAVYPVLSGSTTAYSGKVRFGCITSGMLSDTSIKALSDEISTLLNALNKTA